MCACVRACVRVCVCDVLSVSKALFTFCTVDRPSDPRYVFCHTNEDTR